MKFILGVKQNMTQIFKEDGTVVPVTLIKAGPCVVTQVKTSAQDGYQAIQIGYGEKKKMSAALRGHLKDLDQKRWQKEFRLKDNPDLKRGDIITLENFKVGDLVKVSGTSKGKGFQGVVRRHSFHGHPSTHGHKDQERMPGSIGAGGLQRVIKGLRMAGHMGFERITVKNLEIVQVDLENNILSIKGAVPGTRGSLVEITGAGEIKTQHSPEVEKEPTENSLNNAKTTEKTNEEIKKEDNQPSVESEHQ